MAQLIDHRERELIRTDLDHNLVVEAAAGTGKTTALVQRIVAVLEAGGTTVDRIVAVTFTEKAAGELKLHMRAQLETARQAAPRPSAAHGYLEAALARLEEARVGTIHSFCADLLRERSLAACVDPLFEPLDEQEARRLFRRAFDGWFEETLAAPPEGIRRSLRRPARPAGPPTPGRLPPPSGRDDGPVERLRQAGWSLAERRDLPAPWRRDPFPRQARIGALVEALHGFAALSARCGEPRRDRLYQATEELRQCSDEVRAAEAVAARDHDGLEARCSELAAKRLPFHRGGSRQYGDGLSRDEVLQALEALRADLAAFARDADADLAALLQAELQAALAAYEKAKAKAGRLDFADLLLRARALIRDNHAVRAEFQDTDPLQAEILLLLASAQPQVDDWRRAVPVAGKVFLVADPKQSIYRFRGADIGVYFQVRDLLTQHGAALLQLTTSFRAVPNIQNAVNAAFAPLMDGDRASQQAEYVPLAPRRADPETQPTFVALPVPRPYGKQRPTKEGIEKSLPDAVAAFVHWLLDASGWTVTDREHPETRVPLAPRHICLLLRRFDSFFAGDVTRNYVRALEARGIRHLLVGGHSFHEREEVETLRAALAAIEWPDDELSVFATLHGSLFAIGDEELLEYRQRLGRLHPFRVPDSVRQEAAAAGPQAASQSAALDSEARARLLPLAAALEILAALHRERNSRPIAETLHLLLEETRAHAGFVLRPSGEQVLANVLHLCEQARAYEKDGGVSFRGFVERLDEDASGRRAAEAPVLEEGSDGVRIMTVHRAKGLEFPVVILADMTANLTPYKASRWLDRERSLCAQRLVGWSPVELLEHADDETRREAAEGIRIAYVAATRARDLLVVPAVGTLAWGSFGAGAERSATAPQGWIGALNTALYPPLERWDGARPAPGCPAFGRDSVLDLPADRAMEPQVRPGLHRLRTGAQALRGRNTAETPVAGHIVPAEHDVVWWDPAQLGLEAPPHFGLRQEELLGKGATPEQVRRDVGQQRAWQDERNATLSAAAAPSLRVQSATERARAASTADQAPRASVQTLLLPVESMRPRGPRFGTLVHAVLAGIALDAGEAQIRRFVAMQARIVGATPAEIAATQAVVARALQHPLLVRAHQAAARGDCRRETPLSYRDTDGTLVEGSADLAFLEGETWTVVDFKTDADIEPNLPVYTRQVAHYATAIAATTGRQTKAVLLRV